MSATWTDNRGTVLEVGQEVAYNMSGEVAKGRIKSIKLGSKHWQKPDRWHPDGIPVIEVELVHPTAGKQPGWVSKVQNNRNLLVIFESPYQDTMIKAGQ
jgi:hypothetical protein